MFRKYLKKVDATLLPSGGSRRAYGAKLAEIESLFSTIHGAFDELPRLQVEIARDNNQRLKINTLSYETLSTIFEITLQLPTQCYAAPTAFAFSHVCSHWRTTAARCPRLWQTIDLDELSDAKAAASAAWVRNLPITLSGCNPFRRQVHRDIIFSKFATILSLNIFERYPEDDVVTPPPMSDEEDDTGSASKRALDWRSLPRHARYPTLPNSEGLFDLLATVPPRKSVLLESITWEISDRVVCPEVLRAPLFQGCTPRLRHVNFCGIRMPWAYGEYGNLETLEITECDFSNIGPQDVDVCCVLRSCPRLSKLVLTSPRDRNEHGKLFEPSAPEAHTDTEHILLPFLSHLSLQMPIDHTRHILESIEADNVRFLSIEPLPIRGQSAEMVAELCRPGLIPHSVFSITHSLYIHCTWNSSFSVIGNSRADGRWLGAPLTAGQDEGFMFMWGLLEKIDRNAESFSPEDFEPGANVLRRLAQTMRPYVQVLFQQSLNFWGNYISHDELVHCISIHELLPCRNLDLVGHAISCVVCPDEETDEMTDEATINHELRQINLRNRSTYEISREDAIRIMGWCGMQPGLLTIGVEDDIRRAHASLGKYISELGIEIKRI